MIMAFLTLRSFTLYRGKKTVQKHVQNDITTIVIMTNIDYAISVQDEIMNLFEFMTVLFSVNFTT